MNELHECDRESEEHRSGGYGPAITYCAEQEDGTLQVGNGEYGSQVNFCPFCGFKARVPLEDSKPSGEPTEG